MRKIRIDKKAKESVLVTLPINAAETLPAAHLTGQSGGSHGVQDGLHNFSPAAVGRNDTITCSRRSFWGDKLVVSVIHPNLPLNPAL